MNSETIVVNGGDVTVNLEEKSQPEQKSDENDAVFVDSLTRLKQARALKKEKKKAVKAVTQKFGSVKMARKMVKSAVRNINIRRNSGRGG